MRKTNRMICPECGAEMNQHAVKIDYSSENPAFIDPALGGAVVEVHTCPECGKVGTKPVSAAR